MRGGPCCTACEPLRSDRSILDTPGPQRTRWTVERPIASSDPTAVTCRHDLRSNCASASTAAACPYATFPLRRDAVGLLRSRQPAASPPGRMGGPGPARRESRVLDPAPDRPLPDRVLADG